MKIGFILANTVYAPTNGVVSQALTWRRGLEASGHEVELVNMWNRNDWTSFDILHFFGFSRYSSEFIALVSKVNPRIVVSPILDPDYSHAALKIYTHWGCEKLRLTNPYHSFHRVIGNVRCLMVRSEYEKSYMIGGFGANEEQCAIVPLSYGVTPPSSYDRMLREPFCLHISLLCDERKNVKRLIEASERYDFRLILGGKLRNKREEEMLSSWMHGKHNVEYLGFLPTEKMMDLYSRAKVFALPSITEGVGIVALDAAACGCDIVITKLGGPHEYYDGNAISVDPYSIDDIGSSVRRFIDGETFQPKLMAMVNKKYSLETISDELVHIYNDIIC